MDGKVKALLTGSGFSFLAILPYPASFQELSPSMNDNTAQYECGQGGLVPLLHAVTFLVLHLYKQSTCIHIMMSPKTTSNQVTYSSGKGITFRAYSLLSRVYLTRNTTPNPPPPSDPTRSYFDSNLHAHM